LRTAPETVIARCLRGTLRTEIDLSGPDEHPEQREDRERDARGQVTEIAAGVMAGLSTAPTPFLGALRAAVTLRAITLGAAPAAERLVFMAAEHALRGGAGRTREDRSPGPVATLARIEAGWIFLPSAALTRNGFRSWQPGRPVGLHDLVEGLTGELDRAIGGLAPLRRWREGVRQAAGARTKRSRLRDVVDLVIREPILTTPHLRDMLELSERAAFTLMDEAAAAGIVRLVTPRRSWRVWARPDMAERLAARTRADRPARGRAGAPEVGIAEAPVLGAGPERAAPPDPEARAQAAAREAEALEKLDAAMARADEILRKYARSG
ncbi:hypothetical protein, partial [Jannaschia formosa]|uniref:hypothetical protein n=1 Tax=Jannaschia formosa TaxID=2259592 RepID=UPI0014300AC3